MMTSGPLNPDRNRDIPGDNTPQPNYNRLNDAQRNLVDRAIYGTLLQGTPGNLQFTATVLNAREPGAGLIPSMATSGPRNPESDTIERRIEGMREQHAHTLLGGGSSQPLQAAARNAPGADESRRALNAIINIDGCSSTCSFTSTVTPKVLNTEINNYRGR